MAEENDSTTGVPFISSLRMSSLQLHELYQELMSVGFRVNEALFLVSQVLVDGVMQQSSYSDYEDFFDEDDEMTNDEEDDFDDGELD